MDTPHATGAVIALVFLGLRLYLSGCIARMLRARGDLDGFAAFIAGWLVITAVHLGLLLLLSAVGAMRRPEFLGLVLLLAGATAWRTRSIGSPHPLPRLPAAAWPVLGVSAIAAAAMALRAVFFSDFTWDAQEYELPRIVLWLHAGSVWVHMPTVQLNIFVNEWNGELLATAYALAAGNYAGMGFANLEVLVVLFVSVTAIARRLGAGLPWSLALGACVACAPAMLGLAGTVKGDLLACTAFLAALAVSFGCQQGERSPALVASVLLASALAVGAKLPVLFPVVALAMVTARSLWSAAPGWRAKWYWLSVVGALMVFTSRFWANLVVYGNPVQRIDGERAQFALVNVSENLRLVAERMFPVGAELRGKGIMWALSSSMGTSAWFIVLAAITAWVIRREPLGPLARKALATTGLILAATVLSMLASPVLPWSFRYFAPGALTLLIVLGALGCRYGGRVPTVLALLAVLPVAINLKAASRPGELVPGPLSVVGSEIARDDTPLRRLAHGAPAPYQLAGTDALGLDGPEPRRIVVYKQLPSSLVPFLGSHAQNEVRLVATGQDLVRIATEPNWDFAAVAQKQRNRDPLLETQLQRAGYATLIDNDEYLIAARHWQLEPLASGVRWAPACATEAAKLDLADGHPSVESATALDCGFLSTEIPAAGSLVLEAQFEGEVAGAGSNAAHLSLYGEQLLIALPPGRYTGDKTFRAVVPERRDGNVRQLAFGLGGWTQGKGHIRLVGLKVSQLHLGSRDAAPSAPAGTPLFDETSLHWAPWATWPGTTLEVRDGLPSVASPQPVDAGFITEELPLDGPLNFEARFEGEVAATDAHAAHLSIQGESMLLRLPAGRYTADQVFRASLPAGKPVPHRRLSFGLGGWTHGSGHIRLVSLAVSRPTAAAVAAAAGIAPQPIRGVHWGVAVFAGLLACCAWLGRYGLAMLGYGRASLLGSGFVAGYAFLGLAMLFSLRYLGAMWPGVVLTLATLALVARKGRALLRESRPAVARDRADRITRAVIAVSVIAWGVAVLAAYAPLAWTAQPPFFRLPEIFDLPKHLFALQSLAAATTWPPPSPFFFGESFAYNVLFYVPQGFVARLAGNPVLTLQLFPLAVLAVAVAVPLTVLDLVRGFTQSRVSQAGAVLLATWVGGVTPLWIHTTPAMGVALQQQGLVVSTVWVDEVFVSAVYVPQHLFAVLCGLVCVGLLMAPRPVWLAVLPAGAIALAGVLSSFFMAPHLAFTLVLGTALALWHRGRPAGDAGWRSPQAALAGGFAAAMFLAAAPFLLDIAHWAQGTGALLTWPVAPRQWIYVFGTVGLVGVLAIPGCIAARRHPLLGGVAIMALAGLALLLVGESDAALKSGLWLRIALVPLAAACLGFMGGARPVPRFLRAGVAAVAVAIFVLNVPTFMYFIRTPWQTNDRGIVALLEYLRARPANTRMALLSTEQVLASLLGRPIDFDFFPVRADSYMPPESRVRAGRFWTSLRNGDAAAWSALTRRYDVIVTPTASAANAKLAARLQASWSGAGYSVYETKAGGAP